MPDGTAPDTTAPDRAAPAGGPDSSTIPDASTGPDTSKATDTSTSPDSSTAPSTLSPRRLTAEVWIVIGLSLGASAVRAVVTIIERLTRETTLREQATQLNSQLHSRPMFDLAYQLINIGFSLVPVVLALYLLSAHGRSAIARIGFDVRRPGRDLAVGVGLAALIGIPGLGLYVVGRALGLTVQIQAAGIDPHWWAIPVLLLSAARSAILEEVIAVAYLTERLRDLRWRVPTIIVASALLRASYHLYQGIGPFIGNAVMGVIFAWYYHRTRRVMPLVVAHFLIDLVAFGGYLLLPPEWLASLGIR